MKRVVLFLLMLITPTLIFSKEENKKIKMTQPIYKIYKGSYEKLTNTFSYSKDNLILPDEIIKYKLVDQNNSLSRIYDFLGRTYGVTYDDKIELTVLAAIDNEILYVWQVQNYKVPENKFKK